MFKTICGERLFLCVLVVVGRFESGFNQFVG